MDILEEMAEQYEKAQLFEAFSVEAHTRKLLNAQLNKQREENAALRLDCNYWRDKWLQQDIRSNVKIDGDIEEAITYYFTHPNKHLLMTKNDGYYCIVDEGDHYFIIFAHGNYNHWRTELTDMRALIEQLYRHGKPIRYTGVSNVLKNHSIEVEEGLFEIRLD